MPTAAGRLLVRIRDDEHELAALWSSWRLRASKVARTSGGNGQARKWSNFMSFTEW